MSFEINRKCINCDKRFATELGLKKHKTRTKLCGQAAKKVEKAQEIKRRRLRNSQIHSQRLRNIGPHKKLSVPHKRGVALTKKEKELVLHTYDAFRSKHFSQ